jgi:prepilin-type N-terminal cleavage/methylation domain-containing protein
MSASVPSGTSENGFSLLEVVVAITVLTVGLLAAGLLSTNMTSGGQRSKYMSLAATLASEKLEDLNRWDPYDPSICVPSGGGSAGSLSSDVLQTTTCLPRPPATSGGESVSVSYYDDVNIALTANGTGTNCPGGTSGCLAETVSSASSGSTVYTTTYHTPDGQINVSTSSTPETTTTFHRRWVIEANPTIGGGAVIGVRRVTVLVTLMDLSVQPPVTFQMSLVRP